MSLSKFFYHPQLLIHCHPYYKGSEDTLISLHTWWRHTLLLNPTHRFAMRNPNHCYKAVGFIQLRFWYIHKLSFITILVWGTSCWTNHFISTVILFHSKLILYGSAPDMEPMTKMPPEELYCKDDIIFSYFIIHMLFEKKGLGFGKIIFLHFFSAFMNLTNLILMRTVKGKRFLEPQLFPQQTSRDCPCFHRP